LLLAVREACVKRFRPILLTTLTTFAGLTPLMLERSVQARFLIPMAVSLAFGVLFATFISLVIVPCLYIVLEDLRKAWRWYWGSDVATTDPAPIPVVAAR
jgi:multidrug efflux pump subunit AcrB